MNWTNRTAWKNRTAQLLAATLLLLPAAAAAQDAFPKKAVEIIVPQPAGGSTDLGARVIAQGLQDHWGVPVKVINQPGGNTVPAVDELMRAAPDGYKVLLDGQSSSSLLPIVVPNLPYKVEQRTYTTLVSEAPMMFAVATNSPIQSMDDLAKMLKNDPKSVSWTTNGGTGVADIAFRQLFKAIGIDPAKTRPVVSRGGSEAATQVAGGHVSVGIASYASFSSFLQSGKVRVLAITAKERSPLLKDIPTATETGYPVIAVQWGGISGPVGLPADVVEAWNKGMAAVLAMPKTTEGLARIGITPLVGNGAAMAKTIEDETNLLRSIFARGA